MRPGHLTVTRVRDVVVIVQDGWFDDDLMERMIVRVRRATEEAHAEHGRCVHVADTRTFEGCSITARFRGEQFLRSMTPLVERVAVLQPSRTFVARMMEISGLFFPRLRYRFVVSVADALAAVGRPELVAEVDLAIAASSRGEPADDEADVADEQLRR